MLEIEQSDLLRMATKGMTKTVLIWKWMLLTKQPEPKMIATLPYVHDSDWHVIT